MSRQEGGAISEIIGNYRGWMLRFSVAAVDMILDNFTWYETCLSFHTFPPIKILVR